MIPLFVFEGSAQETETAEGDYIYLQEHVVSPANMDMHKEWFTKFKALADKTGAPSYTISSNDAGRTIFIQLGSTMAGYDEIVDKAFGAWFKDNPEAGKLNETYSHTIESSKNEVWRHSPLHSYTPKDYDQSISRPYTRIINICLKSGSMPKANEAIKNYKSAFTEAGISHAVRAYWNVIGEGNSCVAIVTSYKNQQAWIDSQKEVQEKIGSEKLAELDKNWGAVQRSSETNESWSMPELSHSKQ